MRRRHDNGVRSALGQPPATKAAHATGKSNTTTVRLRRCCWALGTVSLVLVLALLAAPLALAGPGERVPAPEEVNPFQHIDMQAVPEAVSEEYTQQLIASIEAKNLHEQGTALEKAIRLFDGHAELHNALGNAYFLLASKADGEAIQDLLRIASNRLKKAVDVALETHTSASQADFRAEVITNHVQSILALGLSGSQNVTARAREIVLADALAALERCRDHQGKFLGLCQKLADAPELKAAAEKEKTTKSATSRSPPVPSARQPHSTTSAPAPAQAHESGSARSATNADTDADDEAADDAYSFSHSPSTTPGRHSTLEADEL